MNSFTSTNSQTEHALCSACQNLPLFLAISTLRSITTNVNKVDISIIFIIHFRKAAVKAQTELYGFTTYFLYFTKSSVFSRVFTILQLTRIAICSLHRFCFLIRKKKFCISRVVGKIEGKLTMETAMYRQISWYMTSPCM